MPSKPDRRGENNSNAKLTTVQVLAIRERYDQGGTSYRRLATEYGVDFSLIAHIVNHKIWKGIPLWTGAVHGD